MISRRAAERIKKLRNNQIRKSSRSWSSRRSKLVSLTAVFTKLTVKIFVMRTARLAAGLVPAR